MSCRMSPYRRIQRAVSVCERLQAQTKHLQNQAEEDAADSDGGGLKHYPWVQRNHRVNTINSTPSAAITRAPFATQSTNDHAGNILIDAAATVSKLQDRY